MLGGELAGADSPTVAMLMGRNDVNTTMIYTAPGEDHLEYKRAEAKHEYIAIEWRLDSFSTRPAKVMTASETNGCRCPCRHGGRN